MNKTFVIGVFLLVAFSGCNSGLNKSQSTLEIHDIQGCSHFSPYEGKSVSGIIGIVTHKQNNGFTMQSITPDDLACSSEGIFVFTKNYPGVMVGDLVSVKGLVDEFIEGNTEDHNLSQTEIIKPEYSINQSDYDLPKPIILDDMVDQIPTRIIENDEMSLFDPSEDGLDFYESLESMLVEVRSGVVVGPRNSYNEIVVLPDIFLDSNLISVQKTLVVTKDDANPEKIMVKLPTNFKGSVDVGDRFKSPLFGIMDYSFGNFKLLALSPVEVINNPQIVDPFSAKSDGLTIATYNLENLSPMDESDKFSELAMQIVEFLNSPDLLVLNEIMDNSGSVDDGVVRANQTLQKLVKAIQKAGGPAYLFSDTPPFNNQDGGLEGGNIRTVLFFREDRGIALEIENNSINGIQYWEGRFVVEQNPKLIGEFSSAFNGTRKPRVWLLNQYDRQFFVVGAHLTSQGANTPEWGNQQPPQKMEEGKRIEETGLINQQLEKIHLLNPNIPIFIAGDMNDIPWSDVISTIQGEYFINTADRETLPENYSYIFEGNAQQLDYIFLNKNLASGITQARFMHINSFLDQENAFSDHDPMIIEFSLDH